MPANKNTNQAVIALDIDGTILNYGNHVSELRTNYPLMDTLPPGPVILITNQGGMAFSHSNPAKYPTPQRVANRIQAAVITMHQYNHEVSMVLVSCYHASANHHNIQKAARTLRELTSGLNCHVYTTVRARKPSPYLLKVAGATVYYGDSPEDAAAAQAASITFISVPRFL